MRAITLAGLKSAVIKLGLYLKTASYYKVFASKKANTRLAFLLGSI